MCAPLAALACLTAMVVGFKLAGVLDWSWWWVLGPTACAAGIVATFLRK